ncbi:formylglycine-generating enzyme family protein [Capnocytophaga cynodegmi]|uniref:BIG2 domain-containing protein n=1 Tax=Capnocytophaga cynodegmi TaxID=28189 RepID=A0A0B7HFN0_9FLAO|nr:SUMF1/EgtB/PvdO family nonheme iron enzyme [Capnocytophaga cynodegmi]CEN36368.1 exported hypothetical protein [Capnocytophaga cynodegmi]
MKKFFAYAAIVLMVMITATNCSKKDEVTYDNLKLSIKNVSVRVGENASFKINAGSGEYEVMSSDNNVVTVSISNSNVTLKGIAVGEATITVLDKKTNQRSSVKVSISKELLNLELDAKEVSLLVGQQGVVNISSGNGKYEVVVADQSIATATLSQTTITISGVAVGTTTTTIKDVESGKEASIAVTIAKKESITLSVSNVVVKAFTVVEVEQSRENGTLLDNKVKVEIVSGGGNYSVVTSNDKVATVTISGNELVVTGLSSGVATITISNEVNEAAVLEVKVYNLIVTPNGLNLEPNATAEVLITEGSGEYEILNKNASVEVTQSENKLTVKGVQVTENAEIIVKDKISGKEVSLEVRVTASVVVPTDEDVVFVEGGTFVMGSSRTKDERFPDKKHSSYSDLDEVPMHRVTLSSFKISKYEITNAQYAKFLSEKGNKSEGGFKWYNGTDIISKAGKYEVLEGRENYPVTFVSWYGAKAYAEWAGGSLPTEAQWEYAALGGKQSKGYLYAGSDDVNEVAFHIKNSKGIHPVGLKKPNELGIYDMSGNVWEWTADRYAPYKADDQTDPEPVTESTDKRFIRRGASVYCKPTYCRSANRGANNSYQNNIGFRVVFKN